MKDSGDKREDGCAEELGCTTTAQGPGSAAGRWSFVLSVLAVVVSSVFAFGLSGNISGVNSHLSAEAETVQALEKKIAGLEQLVRKDDAAKLVRDELNNAVLADVLHRLEGLVQRVDDPALVQKINDAAALLREVQGAAAPDGSLDG